VGGDRGDALPYDQRPADRTPVHTLDLPATPTRDRNIVASAWVEAPADLLHLGDDLAGQPEAEYKRRIGGWLLWRAGPAVGDARYWAGDVDDLSRVCTYRLRPDHVGPDGATNGEGAGPDGIVVRRFRAWKESLLDRG
jgi:hypothetical protein